MKTLVVKQYHFSAAHTLPFHRGKCSQPHGHNYLLEVAVTGQIQSEQPKEGESSSEAGMIIDFGNLDVLVQKRILDKMDHHSLNELLDNPTAENIATLIFSELADSLFKPSTIPVAELPASGAGRSLVSIKLWETPDAYVEVREWRS